MRVGAVPMVLAMTLTASVAHADIANVRLIQRPVEDVPETRPGWIEGAFRYQDFDGANASVLGLRGTARLGTGIEAGASVGYASFDFDGVSGNTDGLFDPELFIRYAFEPGETSAGDRIQLGIGGALSLPMGDEDLLQETFDVELFGALRYYGSTVGLVGSMAFRVNGDVEVDLPNGQTFEIGGEMSFFVGGAVLAPISEEVTFVGELDIETERLEGADSDVRLTPGIDALLGESAHLRGGLGIGLADGSPDLEAVVSVAIDL